MDPLVVLLVDANPILRQSVVRFVEEHAADRLKVGCALSNGMEALALAANLRPAVVLWGTGVPALPQLQLLPHLRTILPQVGIIVLGVLDDEGYQKAALSAGADAFLPKDSLQTTLLPTIVQVMRDRDNDALRQTLADHQPGS